MGGRIVSDIDAINPPHYRSNPSGVECCDIAEHLGYRLGCSWKYVWRAGLKTVDASLDYAKAHWYLDRERLARTTGDVMALPLQHEVIQRGYQSIKHETGGRYDALQAILWAASNNDPADVMHAMEHVRALHEGCNT
jgi:hypothetical protein